jgi:hypothetical protein
MWKLAGAWEHEQETRYGTGNWTPGGKVDNGWRNQIELVRKSIHGEEKLSEKIWPALRTGSGPRPCLTEELNSVRETLTEEIPARLRARKWILGRVLLWGQGSQRPKNEKRWPDLGLKTLAAESIQAEENKTEDLSSKNKL